jgi:TRAP-type C4-dicarboxylate transport system permease small subunit
MNLIDRLSKAFALIAGYMLFVLMLFIVVNSAFRYMFGGSLFGAQEVMAMLLVPATLFALAHCACTGGHVAVDLFENRIGRIGRLLGDVLAGGLGLGLLVLLIWSAWNGLHEAIEWEETSNLLKLPLWPSYVFIIFSVILYAVVLLVQLIRIPFRVSCPAPVQQSAKNEPL